MAQQFDLVLESAQMIAPGVRHMAFRRGDGESLAFVPGQFLQIHFEHEERMLRRSYSIASRSEAAASGVLEIAVSYVEGGPATALLSALQPGEAISASGPYGRFCLHDDDANMRYLLIATGTGVTPYRAMLEKIQARIEQRQQSFVLLFGARSGADLLYGDEFAAFAEQHPGFRFFPCYSREPTLPARADDRIGYVQSVLTEIKADAERDIAYLCGNPNMVDACFNELKVAGLPIPHIRREKYISPK